VTLDIATLFAVTVFTMGVGGLLLLFAWLQARGTTSLAWWGGAFILFAVSTSLFGSRGLIADVWSMQASGTLMMLAYGLLWTGARVFEGRQPVLPAVAAGAIGWFLAWQFDAFAQSMPARIAFASCVVAGYSLLFVRELWRGRRDGLVSRWPVMAIAIAHAAIFPFRVPAVVSLPFPLGTPTTNADISSLLIFAPLIYNFALVFLLMALTKERAESHQRHAATIDALTGIPNRRGFGERAERLIGRSRRERTALSLLLFDLDRFKAINDRFGHRTGDTVLILFSNAAAQSLRPLDLVGRIGGEEFVALLPGVTPEIALEVAERVRSNFAMAASEVGGERVTATVSVGTASVAQDGYDFDALYACADAALYRAKQKGRNRIEAGRPVTADSPRERHTIVPVHSVGELITRA
jgi:diguanylate cyclase (GGDEF)-like protein